MKYLDEYRDREISQMIVEKIRKTSRRPARLMEICGTHTMAIFRHGIRSLLPAGIELLSGPGCPVCVTSMEDIDRCVALADIPGIIITTFGDMIRVPGSVSSLGEKRSRGADVRMVYSTFDALDIARQNSDKDVVFLGVGFETTAPTVAAAIKTAFAQSLKNFSVLSAHKLLPPAMDALLTGGDLEIEGFICPGHVTTVIGTSPYERIAEQYHVPCVVIGFEPVDILQGILMLIEQIENGRSQVEIQYARGANPQGNKNAMALLDEIFVPRDSKWRGLGLIADSGLRIREKFAVFDAERRFSLSVPEAHEPKGCRCAEVLKGAAKPVQCGLFRKLCTPRTPVGPCMVSSEGTCAAYFKYHIDQTA
ncbi:MAG: hydrogenase formation protein HypD [Deltaproteobacteria bacterium CG17_big_fil_post_rev_8_21_14_2_50_51_6]|nr:MAG: hydrogenase formation protein HypD [Deltaproteobacteria bacterium CG17_big_fil_post_rev_8_21_14_2_50_51_6]